MADRMRVTISAGTSYLLERDEDGVWWIMRLTPDDRAKRVPEALLKALDMRRVVEGLDGLLVMIHALDSEFPQ
jgi:hypothetical protein